MTDVDDVQAGSSGLHGTGPMSATVDLPREVRQRLPNLLVAGVPRGGTTSLFRYLAQHPEVCASRNKELRYFDAVRYGEPMLPLASYAEHFTHCTGERYRMEGTPGYFSGGQPVASAVDGLLDDPHVVVILRDPVERCWSWYRFVRGRARIPKDMSFGRYLDVCEQLRARGADALRENQAFAGLRGGCYDEWFGSWRTIFGDRLHVEFFDDLVADAPAVVGRVLRWLDIDAEPAASFRIDVENASVQYRSKPVLQLALVLNRRGERFFERHADLKRRLRKAYFGINRAPAVDRLGSAERERLAKFYAPRNARLAASLRASGVARLPRWLDPAHDPAAPASPLPGG